MLAKANIYNILMTILITYPSFYLAKLSINQYKMYKP